MKAPQWCRLEIHSSWHRLLLPPAGFCPFLKARLPLLGWYSRRCTFKNIECHSCVVPWDDTLWLLRKYLKSTRDTICSGDMSQRSFHTGFSSSLPHRSQNALTMAATARAMTPCKTILHQAIIFYILPFSYLFRTNPSKLTFTAKLPYPYCHVVWKNNCSNRIIYLVEQSLA